MTKRKPTLIQKYLQRKRPQQDKYRPTTYLPMMVKILKPHIKEEIYNSFISCGLFLKNKKGAPREEKEQEISNTLINTSSKRAKRHEKM